MNACLSAEALFVSSLQPSDQPSRTQVGAAVDMALLVHGSGGCAGMVAEEYGNHPDLAAARMRWAVAAVRDAYQPVAV